MAQIYKTRRYSRHTYGDDGLNGHRNILSVSFVATDLGKPKAVSTVHVLPLSASASGAITTYTAAAGNLTQPDVPRNLTVQPGGTTGDVATMDITITGKNVEGKTISETFPFLANATGAQTGSLAFAQVDSVSIPAQDGANATFKVGIGAKLGIGMRNIASMPIQVMTNTAGTEAIEAASASAFSATLPEANTVTTTTSPNGAIGMRVYVLNYKWAINPTNAQPDYGV
jgi:hypothetical protein